MTRQVLVTGASKGIGKAIAIQLAKDGFHIAVHYMGDKQGAQETLEQIESEGGSGRLIQFDISNREQCREILEADIAEHGAYYGVVNNAGITRDNLLFRMEEDDWNDVMNTNLTSCFHWIKALGRPMTRKRWGRIVNVASVVGLTGNAGQANYSAAKAGMIGLTKSLAREFSARSVTVNAIAPGFIDTDMTSELDERVKEGALGTIPLKRFGTVSDIAEMAAYLCSDKASYVTGQVFTVDGGMVM